jgi:DNA-binding MarR family transcriptional regulator
LLGGFRFPDAATVGLARRPSVTKRVTGKTIALLDERGYFARGDAPADARHKLVQLSPLDHAVMQEGEAISEGVGANGSDNIGYR